MCNERNLIGWGEQKNRVNKKAVFELFSSMPFPLFGMKQINQEILVKMGTLICLNRNPSSSCGSKKCVMWRDIVECELRTPP